jgi:hypothetical protein
MSNKVKSFMGKHNPSSPREKFMLLALAGTIAVAGAYYLTASEDMSNTAGSPPPPKSVVKAQKAKPATNSPQLAMATEPGTRNPFLPPAEFQAADTKDTPTDKTGQPSQPGQSTHTSNPKSNYNNLDKLLTGTGKPTSIVQNERPALVGIVEGAGKRLAIITYDGDSRSYGVYERVGSYQVTSISSSSVILSGPAGRTVLAVGR